MNNNINETIVKFFQTGDEEAFTLLYETYHKRIYFFIFQHCRNEELSKEVVQTTFMEIYVKRKNLKYFESHYSWMLRIAYRQLIRVLNKESKKNMLINYSDDIENILDFRQVDIKQQMENNEIIKVIYNSIESMKPRYKQIAILRYYHELSNKEIASVLSISSGVVKTRVYRVNKIIRQQLQIEELSPNIEKSFAIFSMLVPTMINQVTNGYTDFLSVQEIVNNVGKITLTVGSKILTLKMLLLSLAGVTSTGVIYYTYNQSEKFDTGGIVELSIPPMPCVITSVTYETNYTSSPITVVVNTSTEDYDKILINDIETTVVYKNGEYEIKLIKEKVIDRRTIHIDNFDTEAPVIVSSRLEGGIYYIELEDSQSGVKYDSIRYYCDDIRSDAYAYDVDTNVLSFQYQSFSKNIFYIEDFLGNWREIKIV